MSRKKHIRKVALTTMAASAAVVSIAPVASAAETKEFSDVPKGSSHYEGVQWAVAEGIVKGYEDGTFGVGKNLSRPHTAVMFANALGLEPLAASEVTKYFSDVTEKTPYAGYIAAVAKAGIFSGDANKKFQVNKPLTREQMATVLVKAFKLDEIKGKPTVAIKLDNVDPSHKANVQILADLEITNQVKDFRPGQAVQRGQFATFLKLATEQSKAAAKPVVASASAIDGKTLKVTGTGLTNLKAEDVSLKDNEVESVVAEKDGKTASVKFKHSFTPEKEQTVTFKGEKEDKELKFTYSVSDVKSVALDTRTYDDDTANQTLTFKVNGEATTADTEWLRQAGYSVNFVAVDNSTNAAATKFFADASNSTSSTGLLANEVPVGTYTVEIQVVKDGKVVVSDKKEIKVADLESTTSAISSVELTNGKGFVHNSSTLVAGETADVTKIVGDAAGKKNVSIPVTGAEVTSSNSSVISVNNQKLTANGPGTATVTVKVGDSTKTINLTVANKAREIAKITPTESTVKVVQGKTRTIDVNSVDQYGDPIAVLAGSPIGGSAVAGSVEEDLPKDSANANLISAVDVVTTAKGKTAAGLAIQASSTTKGNGTLIFKDANGKNIGQVGIQVTDVDNVASTKVEYTVASDKTTNSIEVGDVNEYQVSKFNTAGFYNGAETLNTAAATGELTVSSADTSVANVSLVTGNEAFKVTPVKAGTTDIVIKDENGLVKHKFTVTITESPIVITKANFKSLSTVNYAGKKIAVDDVLDVRPDATNDSIVYGVEHNADTIAKVRLTTTAPGSATAPALYIDTNNGGGTVGTYEATNDILLGQVSAEVLTGATGTMTAGAIDLAPSNYTTAATDKGTILFRVIAPKVSGGSTTFPVTNTVASTVLNVDVK